MKELKIIMQKFANSGWDLIAKPAKQWLESNVNRKEIIEAIKQSDKECVNCG